MDALSFAMGERTASLRVRHLRDLVHGAHIGRPVSDTARVSLHYCDDEEQETVFCRSVSGQYNGVRFPCLLHVFYRFIVNTMFKGKLREVKLSLKIFL